LAITPRVSKRERGFQLGVVMMVGNSAFAAFVNRRACAHSDSSPLARPPRNMVPSAIEPEFDKLSPLSSPSSLPFIDDLSSAKPDGNNLLGFSRSATGAAQVLARSSFPPPKDLPPEDERAARGCGTANAIENDLASTTSVDSADPTMANRVYEVVHSDPVEGSLVYHACGQCHRRFKRRCHVYDHVRRVHDRLRPHICEYCGQGFPQKSSRARHIAIVHEKKKPFHCHICDKTFGKKNALTVHIRTVHEKLRPFSCTVCGQSFGVKSHMNKHVRIVHERHRPHQCQACSNTFGERSDLRKHERTMHGIIHS